VDVKIPGFMGDKSALVDVETADGCKHISWELGGGKIISFEVIPDNYPSTSVCIWNSIDEYIEGIKSIDWIMDKNNQKKFNIKEEEQGKMLEILFEDLNEEGKKKVLDFYGIKKPSEANLDIVPLFVLEREKREEAKQEKNYGF